SGTLPEAGAAQMRAPEAEDAAGAADQPADAPARDVIVAIPEAAMPDGPAAQSEPETSLPAGSETQAPPTEVLAATPETPATEAARSLAPEPAPEAPEPVVIEIERLDTPAAPAVEPEAVDETPEAEPAPQPARTGEAAAVAGSASPESEAPVEAPAEETTATEASGATIAPAAGASALEADGPSAEPDAAALLPADTSPPVSENTPEPPEVLPQAQASEAGVVASTGSQNEAGPAAETSPAEAEPEVPLAPVQATNTPASEPLLAQAPPALPSEPSPEPSPEPSTAPPGEPSPATTPEPAPEPSSGGTASGRPPVLPMPSGATGIAVNRGAAAEESAQRPGGAAVVRRLPVTAEAADPTDTDPSAEPDLSDLPAVRRFAATPALMPGEVPMGVVLIEAAEAEAAILALALPLTIALDPADSDAPRRAAVYRAAGHEIALIATGVPALATASDLAVTLDGWRRAFPETVAIIDRPVNGLGANARLARNMAEMLASEGLGAVSLRDGPDAWLGAARNEGLPSAPVYRDLDDGGQNEFTVRRLIDRGAFEALRQPGIVIAGSAADPSVISELAGFARGGGRAGVGLAPVSSVLQGR
ncbi:MAG: divergent polysaccharide deacetylase family protein, partial [Pararhodobacter sp.]